MKRKKISQGGTRLARRLGSPLARGPAAFKKRFSVQQKGRADRYFATYKEAYHYARAASEHAPGVVVEVIDRRLGLLKDQFIDGDV